MLSSSFGELNIISYQKRLEGTKVTVESFLKWKEKFEAELAELDGVKKNKDTPSGDKKLTGMHINYYVLYFQQICCYS